jgi:5-formyltetrahydrofolate cyclo-ligase
LRHPWFKLSRSVAFYWPADGEISPLPLLRPAMRLGKTLYLPVIRRHSLVFRRYRPGNPLRHNRFGIPEPAPHQPTLLARQLDLVLVPLVGFDLRCNRLGMGAGFYDRCFDRAGTRLRCIGLAHELQKIASVPQDPWDKPLHAVVTDRTSYKR